MNYLCHRYSYVVVLILVAQKPTRRIGTAHPVFSITLQSKIGIEHLLQWSHPGKIYGGSLNGVKKHPLCAKVN
jgi:hypothetical protein